MYKRQTAYRLTDEEQEIVSELRTSFAHSPRLQEHMEFLYRVGSMYLCFNENLLYHGCLPMNEDGSFAELVIDGKMYAGRDLMDILDQKMCIRDSAYALREGQVRRYSDDGEPQGTAGIPVLDVLQKSGIVDAVVVVTRYFGGTLLGAGGLVRAYTEGAAIAVRAARPRVMSPCTVLQMDIDYGQYGKITYIPVSYTHLSDGYHALLCRRHQHYLRRCLGQPLQVCGRAAQDGRQYPGGRQGCGHRRSRAAHR